MSFRKNAELRKHLGNINSWGVHNKSRLAKDVLEEVPLQLTKWMKSRGISPNPPLVAEPYNPYGLE